jgi:hypothetical protein
MPYALDVLYDDVAQLWNDGAGLFGSGRLIAQNLVLTARHVVTLEGMPGPLRDGWQVRLHAHRLDPSKHGNWPWIKGSVIWVGSDRLDLALVQLTPRAGTPDSQPSLKLPESIRFSITQSGDWAFREAPKLTMCGCCLFPQAFSMTRPVSH